MSATSKPELRRNLDFYQTPTWVTDSLLDYLEAEYHFDGINSRFDQAIDVGCGDGAILDRLARRFDEEKVVGVELDKVRAKLARQRSPKATVLAQNFLSPPTETFKSELTKVGAKFWISNPPFERAREFLRQAIRLNKMRLPGKHTVDETNFLIRMGFMSSTKRKAWHKEHGGEMLILPRRPSFCHSFTCRPKDGGCGLNLKLSTSITVQICPACDNGKMKLVRTDAADYCWLRYVLEGGKIVNERTWDIL